MTDIGLWAIAAATPDRTAVIEPNGRAVSYAELAALADRYGRGLQALGLRPGGTVAGMLPNSTEALALFFAAMQTGLYVVPVNWHLTAPEVAYILSDSGAAAFVAHERFADVAAEAAEGAGIEPGARFAVGAVPGFAPLTALGADGPGGRPDPRTAGAPMVYTSGTSGRPKGVRRPLTGEDPDKVPWTATWFFGIFSARAVRRPRAPVLLAALPHGGAELRDDLDPARPPGRADGPLRARGDARPDRAAPGDPHAHGAHAVPPPARAAGADPRPLRRVVAAGRDPQRRALPAGRQAPDAGLVGAGGDRVLRGQRGRRDGITAQEWLARPGSVGRAWPGTEVRVLDAEGNDVPAGQPGLVYLRMGTSTFDYHQDEEKTRASRARGMFTVGDIGYLDADGYLYLCDRKSDMIISGGVNIYPAEIEAELSGHPAVDDVAVFGIPHDDWGEEIKAVVQPVPGAEPGPALTAELLAFLGDRVAKFKLPKTIDYVAELPRDPNGKLYKRRLRDPYWEGRDRAI